LKKNIFVSLVASIILVMSLVIPQQETSAKSKEKQEKVEIYLLDENGSLKAKTVSIKKTKKDLEQKVQQTFNSLFNFEKKSGSTWSEVPKDTAVKNVKLENGHLTLDLNSKFLDNLSNNHNVGFILEQLKKTAFQFSGVSELKLLFDGKEKEYLGMYIVSEPIERNPENVNSDDTVTSQDVVAPDPTVVIDPGHGGDSSKSYFCEYDGEYYKGDPGAVSDGYEEADLALDIALELKNDLETYMDATVYMTRNDDTFVCINDRWQYANSKNPDFTVSVHLNGSTNTGVDGSTVLHPDNHDVTLSTDLANDVHNKVLTYTNLTEWTAPYASSVGVLKYTDMPAILTETGFISNDNDRQYILNNTDDVAYGIYKGIDTWWNDN